ncbi:MAG: PGF-CTERM sorting domain-containing protein [Euryarchaeota archaeon]|nr:PGF-CTERM sorting domain-containing protein [Euryarchaeota archaeon]
MNTKRMVGIVAVATAMLLAITSASPVMAQDVSAVVEKIDKNMADLKGAAEIIHEETDAIIGIEGVPDEMKDTAETVHLSTHALNHIGVYMGSDIGKLDTYKADPDKNREEMLFTLGKIEALRKLYQDTIDSGDFVTTMRLPVTGKSPYDLIHLLIENQEVQASPEAISAAGDVHSAVHDLEDAAKSMRLNLEELEDALAEAPAPTPKESGSEIVESVGNIDKNMVELKGAAEVMHEETKVIISGVESMPDEMKATAKTVHLSSHALKHIEVYMDSYIGKLDSYKAEPEKNKAEMLVTAGKIEALRKLYQDTIDSGDFVTTMELPVTGKSPYDLIHLLIENQEVQASPEAISAAGDVHSAVHDLEDAAKSMRLNLEELEDAFAELEEPAAAAPTPTTTPTPEAAGFEAAFAIAGILAVACAVFRKNR